MFYYLFEYLDKQLDLWGAGVFQYISFRAGMAAALSLLITIAFGKTLIRQLKRLQVGEKVRDLGLEGQKEKEGTPTMGGIIIIAAIVIPTLLFAQIHNVYIILLLITAVWLGLIGFTDDYLKIKKKNKEGLAGRFKIVGQIGVGLIVGLVLVFHDSVVIREFGEMTAEGVRSFTDVKSVSTTLPFVK
ncbi:MAG: phospho-N-acetylmuramoyl-pentapeptide-transferase, partial [Bacteroidota bacterium]